MAGLDFTGARLQQLTRVFWSMDVSGSSPESGTTQTSQEVAGLESVFINTGLALKGSGLHLRGQDGCKNLRL